MRADPLWRDPLAHLVRVRPDTAVMYFSPAVLQATARRFRAGFDGLVTYAVKANPRAEVLENLVAAGVGAFDVASPQEMRAARAVLPDAVLHYNNPVRSCEEVAFGISMGVASWSVDCATELDKLADVPRTAEVSVRLALPVAGAAYDFGDKFGAGVGEAVQLLRRVAQMGFIPAMTFHPGTQCTDASAWAAYVRACAEVARQAGVRLARLNVGGGFAAHRTGAAGPDLEAVFERIRGEVNAAFGACAPALVCEPGRAMVNDAFTLAARVKALRAGGAVFINDGIYGGLAELRDIAPGDRISVHTPDGAKRGGAMGARIVYGPTCDSLDRLPEPVSLPDDLAEGDYLLFHGQGAYSLSIATRFNGYGPGEPVTVARV
ncbi:MAG: type III PLP-dependent enzyme [Sediminimonas sp.]|uniref:type III PLP-dependent enzyme n=1 Tax=Sediminimonas sp. TaxID=2823379 RepID=UPI0028703C5D|nr:type III PLP-dependent enzyme [Sediminimonas sp.]MDR9484885.1 type III PLP-dependent enzyme [Sediminimonas sp.]